MIELNETQAFVKAMLEVNEKHNGTGRFERPFPDLETARILRDFLIQGQQLEISDWIKNYDLLTDTADVMQMFDDENQSARYMKENMILACKMFIDSIKADIEEIEAANNTSAEIYQIHGEGL